MIANDGHLVSSSDLGGEEEPFLADGIKCKELNFLNIPFYFHLKKILLSNQETKAEKRH